ncbi:MAG: glycosyltransferase family 2 protein [bacterium]|nr:glycosyltransferase family 2 protein [bacterium]
MKYLLSIIIPVYNAEQYLPRLFQSLMKQNQELIQIIFINDGSIDKSYNLLINFQINKKNVSVYNQKNKGGSAARNYGLQAAIGKYILFFDSDDFLEAGVLERAIARLEETKADILIGNMKMVNTRGIGRLCLPVFKEQISTDIEKLFYLEAFPGNKIYRRDIIEKYKINFADVKIIQDVNFYLKYISHCCKIAFLSDNMYYYVVHNDSVSHLYSPYITDVIKSLRDVKKHYIHYGLYEKFQKLLEYEVVRFISYQIPKITKIKGIRNRIVICRYFRRNVKPLLKKKNEYINDILRIEMKQFCTSFLSNVLI